MTDIGDKMNKNIIRFGICILIVAGLMILEEYTNKKEYYCIFFIMLIAFFVYMLIHNIVMLRISRQIRSEFSNRKRKTVTAKVYKIRHTLNTSFAKKAWANYRFTGADYTGKMICAIDRELYEGHSYNVYICKKYPKYFTFSEQQAKNAVMTYLTFSIISFIGTLFFVLIGILFIVSNLQKN